MKYGKNRLKPVLKRAFMIMDSSAKRKDIEHMRRARPCLVGLRLQARLPTTL